jgi:hypothetical protein
VIFFALSRDGLKGVSAARTGQGRRSRLSRPLTGSTAGINADTKGAGDEEKSRRRNEHSEDEAPRRKSHDGNRLLRYRKSPAAFPTVRAALLPEGSRNRLQCGHVAAPEIFMAAIGPQSLRGIGKPVVSLSGATRSPRLRSRNRCGAFNFDDPSWKSERVMPVAVSNLRDRQEAMLLMQPLDWVRTTLGVWQLRTASGLPRGAALELPEDGVAA